VVVIVWSPFISLNLNVNYKEWNSTVSSCLYYSTTVLVYYCYYSVVSALLALKRDHFRNAQFKVVVFCPVRIQNLKTCGFSNEIVIYLCLNII
jgi:hypothetical protein